MDIPSIAEIHQFMDGAGVQFQTVSCSVCNAEFPLSAASAHTCAPYMKERLDELEARLKAAEQKLHEMELKFWVMEGDGR